MEDNIEDKGKVNASMWEVHKKYKEEFIKRYIFLRFHIPKESILFVLVWMITILSRRTIRRKLDYMGFIIHSFKKRVWGGVQYGIYRYPNLKHLIELCPGYWEEYWGMINELDSDRNKYEFKEGNIWMVWRFPKKDIWKCIGYIILEMTYGKKVCRLWRKPHKYNYG